ncbi:uncharacterized protein (DUF58 family) [Geodermatophilus bullaregiensis]|uniref:DUF58 domain-containing protein n=1 Tax=Geodermatophilus bullaregiensis TaxID=1564160 RepID=UPI0027DDA819|nr:DUF58 domain-containing protein [Geodermatophilus bullaregiensis]MBM7808626.1 uncharacterized protein (DUF58 family) [Geodermatophilus bullaregiensis]
MILRRGRRKGGGAGDGAAGDPAGEDVGLALVGAGAPTPGSGIDPGNGGGAPPHFGEGPADVLLQRLELTVRRRLDGLLQGDHLGLVPGSGTEAGDSRTYHPGDDVRRMDWPVTARTQVPHVRETIADRELETWAVVDLSASLDFGTGLCDKRDLAIAGLAAVSHLTVRGGNRLGAVVTTGERVDRYPAQAGRLAADRLLRAVVATPRATSGRRGDLAAALETLRRPPRRRGLVVVVSDFLGDTDWERPLRGLGAQHELLGIEVVDPRELELPDVGLLTVVDPESGQTLEVPTGDPRFRARFAEGAAEQRRAIATGLRRAGAGHLQLRTDRDWLMDVVRFVADRRRAGSGGASR